MAYLKINNICKKFGAFTALHSISLEVNQGEFVCFLGPSGCGKTTLLRTVAGLETQSDGQIFQGGKEISLLPPAKRDFGIVFQSYALFPNLTVAQNIAYGLKGGGAQKEKNKQRVSQLLEMMNIQKQGDKYPGQMSGGQQQRVAMARALAPDPNLLLLDEPLSALDAKVRGHLRKQLKSLQRELGVTTILVTHDQEEAITLADRIVVMNHGYIEQVGTPFEIYEKPTSPFVADFIGHMNIFPGKKGKDNLVLIGSSSFVSNNISDNILKGDEVAICIRPEKLGFISLDEHKNNSLELSPISIEFRAAKYRVEFELPSDISKDGEPLSLDLSAEELKKAELKLGKKTSVYFPADQIHVFKKDSHPNSLVA